MQRYTATILSFTLLWDKAIVLHYYITLHVGNMLIDNPKKTEIIHLTFYTAPEPVPAIKTGDCSITPRSEVKGLGVPLDRLVTFKTHMDNICRSTSRSIHHIGKIRNFLSGSPTERLIRAFGFFSKLDSCDSILHGLPSCELEKLQRFQNTTARLTVRAKCQLVITPVWRVYTGAQWKKELFLKFSWSRTKSSMALLQPI